MYYFKASSRPKSLYWAKQQGEVFDPKTSERDYGLGCLDIQQDVYYKSMNGQKLLDVVGSSGGGTLFSLRLKEYIEERKLTGLEFHPVQLILKDGRNIKYFLVRTNNECSELDSSSAVLQKREDTPSISEYIGYTLDMKSVTANFTRPIRTLRLLCDENTKNDLNSKFTGFIFNNISELKVIGKI
jgi:hypothetical protein